MAALSAILEQPERQIDFAKTKLLLDKFIDPQIDAHAALGEIDGMVRTIRTMAGPDAPPIARLAAVRRFIYVDGDWNGHRPFAYDLRDPFGRILEDKLLTTYLKTRRGNCVSMPIPFISLADRLGVHVTLSTAPAHLFAKYIDDAIGKAYNLETTSGGYPARDEWYEETTPMSGEAIANGVYLKTLSRKETVAVMAETLVEHYMAARSYRTVIGLSEVILKFYPQFAPALIDRGVAYVGLINIEFARKYPRPMDIPLGLQPTYRTYVSMADTSFDKAEALGWRQDDGVVETTAMK